MLKAPKEFIGIGDGRRTFCFYGSRHFGTNSRVDSNDAVGRNMREYCLQRRWQHTHCENLSASWGLQPL